MHQIQCMSSTKKTRSFWECLVLGESSSLPCSTVDAYASVCIRVLVCVTGNISRMNMCMRQCLASCPAHLVECNPVAAVQRVASCHACVSNASTLQQLLQVHSTTQHTHTRASGCISTDGCGINLTATAGCSMHTHTYSVNIHAVRLHPAQAPLTSVQMQTTGQ